MNLVVRDYDPGRDRDSCHRIWREIGWIKPGEESRMDLWTDGARAHVGEAGGQAECLVLMESGSMRYQEEEIPFSCVSGVTTSWVARKQGLAQRVHARALSVEAGSGAPLAALGMFEQGYYNLLGYGTTSYIHQYSFDPASLLVRGEHRVPERLTGDDWEAIHASRNARLRRHGGCNILPAKLTHAEMLEDGFALGYRDESGALTHHFAFQAKEVENGPYYVRWMAWQNRNQFRELISLLQSLGDQVRSVTMDEPPGIQLQDLVRHPIKQRAVTRLSPYEGKMGALAPFQLRILDLPACLAQTHLAGRPVRFNLALTDPVESILPDDCHWRGIAGSYVVQLGEESFARPGEHPGLPTLETTVSAFTRLWLGVQPPTGLAYTDDVRAPESLLHDLDYVLRLPQPLPDWNF